VEVVLTGTVSTASFPIQFSVGMKLFWNSDAVTLAPSPYRRQALEFLRECLAVILGRGETRYAVQTPQRAVPTFKNAELTLPDFPRTLWA